MKHKQNRKVAAFRLKEKLESREWRKLFLSDEQWIQDTLDDGFEYLDNLDVNGDWCRWYKDGRKEILESKFDLWMMIERPEVYERRKAK